MRRERLDLHFVVCMVVHNANTVLYECVAPIAYLNPLSSHISIGTKPIAKNKLISRTFATFAKTMIEIDKSDKIKTTFHIFICFLLFE